MNISQIMVLVIAVVVAIAAVAGFRKADTQAKKIGYAIAGVGMLILLYIAFGRASVM